MCSHLHGSPFNECNIHSLWFWLFACVWRCDGVSVFVLRAASPAPLPLCSSLLLEGSQGSPALSGTPAAGGPSAAPRRKLLGNLDNKRYAIIYTNSQEFGHSRHTLTHTSHAFFFLQLSAMQIHTENIKYNKKVYTIMPQKERLV